VTVPSTGLVTLNVALAPSAAPEILSVQLNGRATRSVGSVDPSGLGVAAVRVEFSQAVTFTAGSVEVWKVSFPGGVEVLGPAISPQGVTGSDTHTMILTLGPAVAVDTWVKVTLKSSGITRPGGLALDGEVPVGGSRRGYLYSAPLDLPTGNGLAGGDAVFYVGSLRCDFAVAPGDGPVRRVTPEDMDGFLAAFAAGDADADFCGPGTDLPDGQITPADLAGFTSVYNQAVAEGRHLGPLLKRSTWTGAADNHWENGANWSTGAVPGRYIVARIDGAAVPQPVMEQDETVWGLDLAAGATLTFAPGTPKTLVTEGLTIAESGGVPTARLDLASGRLIVNYDNDTASPVADVRRWLVAGCACMTWTGSGITSSAVAGSTMTYGVGYAQNDMLSPPYDVFSGVPVASSTVLVKYTYLGDVNLDGKVDDNDVTIMVLNYGIGWKPGKPAGPANWQMGDVTYDGKVDDNDITFMALRYGAGWKPGKGGPCGGDPVAAALPTAAPEVLMTPDAIQSVPLVEDGDVLMAQATRARQAALGSAQAAGGPGAAPTMLLARSGPYQGSAFSPGSGTFAVDDPPLVFLAATGTPLAWSTAEEVAPNPGAALSPDGGVEDLLLLPALEILTR
jgi:hypothetical protein